MVAELATEGDGLGERARRPGSAVDLVIGSDTIVVLDGRILEKPRSEAAAYEMLSTLRFVLRESELRAPHPENKSGGGWVFDSYCS